MLDVYFELLGWVFFIALHVVAICAAWSVSPWLAVLVALVMGGMALVSWFARR